MAASKENPKYTVKIKDGSTTYDVTPTLTNMDFSDQSSQMAQSVTITLMNVKVNKKNLSSLIKLRQRVFISANDGEKKGEVFRGWIWSMNYDASTDAKEIIFKCYDNLMYLQESEDSFFFSKGKSTKEVMNSIFKKWGVKHKFTYSSITHAKLVLRGDLSNIITADVLDLVKDKTGDKYVITSKKDVVNIAKVGTNSTVYKITNKKNAIKVLKEQSMDGMITKVVIVGKKDDSEKLPVEATVKGNTSKYGTLQKILDRDSDTSLAKAKKEAKNIIKENGKPSWEAEIRTADIPWIRKGDKVYVDAGGISKKELIVINVSRSISNKAKTMTLDVEKP